MIERSRKIKLFIEQYYAISIVLFYCVYLFLPYRLYSFIDPSVQKEENWMLNLLIIGLFSALALRKQIRIAFNRLDIGVFLYFIYISIRSFEVIAASNTIILLVLYLMLRFMKLSQLFVVFIWVIVSVYLQIIIGYLELAYQWDTLADITGTYLNSGILGCHIAVSILLIFILKLFWSLNGYAATFLSISLFIPLIYADSRSSWLALIISVCYIMQKKWSALGDFLRKYRLLILFLLLGVFTLLFYYKIPSAQGRLYIWFISLLSSDNNIVFGLGNEAFQTHYMIWQAQFLKANPNSCFAFLADEITVPYNEFLKIYVENGLVGVVLFLTIIYNAFSVKEILKSTEGYVVLCRGVLLCLLLFSFFSYPFSYVQFKLLMIVCLAILSSSMNVKNCVLVKGVTWKWLKVAVGGLGFFFLHQQFDYFQIEKKWDVAIREYPTKKIESIKHMQQVAPVLSKNPFFLSSFAAMRRENGEYSEAIRLYKTSLSYRNSYYTYIDLGKCYSFSDSISMALKCWNIASQMIPSRFLPIYLSAQLHIDIGNWEKAMELKEELRRKKRKVDSPEIDRMLLELNDREIGKSD